MFNFEDEKKKQEKLEATELRQLCDDINNCFNNPSGMRVLRRIFGHCGLYSDGFTGDNGTFYNSGLRAAGLRILEDIMEADPNIYINTLKGFDNG